MPYQFLRFGLLQYAVQVQYVILSPLYGIKTLQKFEYL